MKGIILAGGMGTRLRPITNITNKHLVPILNKPMIVYPLKTLKTFGVHEILVVSGGDHIGHIAEYLGDGSEFSVDLTYKVQRAAGGIAQALGLAEDFATGSDVVVVLGDNIFDNHALASRLALPLPIDRAHIFLAKVEDASRFGVPVFKDREISHIEEKPADPKSEYAVTGLYHYPTEVFDIIRTLKPSARGELEITDVNNYFLEKKRLDPIMLEGFWSDAGTRDSLMESIQWAYAHEDA